MASSIPASTRIGGSVEQTGFGGNLRVLHRHVSAVKLHSLYVRRQRAKCFARSHQSSNKEGAGSSQDSTHVQRHELGDLHSSRSNFVCDHQEVHGRNSIYAVQGLAEACKFVYNDAKFVNERAQNDIILLSRGIARLNNRARQDVAVIGMGFLKLDARARKDTQKIDNGVKRRAARLNSIAMVLKERARSGLKRVADRHWSDGALEADLRRADLLVKRRAMEDAFIALKFVRDIHDMMANKSHDERQGEGLFSTNDAMGFITLEKNGQSVDLLSRAVSTDRITAIEEAYWSMASALSEADGIDYTDPEELELIVAALIDLDAMDGKTSVSLLAECSNSPDVNTRKALANALAAAPSMWNLGNAGMGALQRLAQDSNPAVAAAASKAIGELRKQWELQDGDNLRFIRKPQRAAEDSRSADEGSP